MVLTNKDLRTRSKSDWFGVIILVLFIAFNVCFVFVPVVWFFSDSCKDLTQCTKTFGIPYDLTYLAVSVLTGFMSCWAAYIGIQFLLWKFVNREQIRFLANIIPMLLAFSLACLCELPCMIYLSYEWQRMIQRIIACVVHLFVHALVLIIYLFAVLIRKLDPASSSIPMDPTAAVHELEKKKTEELEANQQQHPDENLIEIPAEQLSNKLNQQPTSSNPFASEEDHFRT